MFYPVRDAISSGIVLEEGLNELVLGYFMFKGPFLVRPPATFYLALPTLLLFASLII